MVVSSGREGRSWESYEVDENFAGGGGAERRNIWSEVVRGEITTVISQWSVLWPSCFIRWQKARWEWHPKENDQNGTWETDALEGYHRKSGMKSNIESTSIYLATNNEN